MIEQTHIGGEHRFMLCQTYHCTHDLNIGNDKTQVAFKNGELAKLITA